MYACDASDDGPYDNEGVISKLLCRKLLSLSRARAYTWATWTAGKRMDGSVALRERNLRITPARILQREQ